jgi:hypothetical protein
VSLVAAALEAQGIATVVVQFLLPVAKKIGPPRALWVPYPHGYPLGEPNNLSLQKQVLRAALDLLEQKILPLPILAQFQPESAQP